MHKLPNKLREVLQQLFSAFIKHVLRKCISSTRLKSLEIVDDNIKPKKELFYGVKNERLMKKMLKENIRGVVAKFQEEDCTAYINCVYKVNFPFDNPMLKCLHWTDRYIKVYEKVG